MIHSEHSQSTHPQLRESGYCYLDPATERVCHADGHWNQECGMSLHVIDQSMDGGLQIVGFCDSGPTMSPASAILRFWNVDSALFTPLDRGPQLVDCGVLDSWKVGGCTAAAAIRNLGIVESGNVLQIWHQTELWNLGILESAQHILVNRRFQDYRFHSLGKRGVRGFQTWSRIAHSMIPRSTGDMRTTDILTFHESRIHASLPAAWSVAQVQVTQAV